MVEPGRLHDAYRLKTEEYWDATYTLKKSSRSYTYDAAGNRKTMNQWNSAGVNKTTNYTYGNRNELVSDTGYYRGGTISTAANSYSFDDRGNMVSRTGSTYTWNEDDRLIKAVTSNADPKLGVRTINYKYDHAGRRLLKNVGSGQRTRYFFNGLTEEIKKVSVGSHADTSFGFTEYENGDSGTDWAKTGGTGTVVSQYDADRFSNVLIFNKACDSLYFYKNITETQRVVSYWMKRDTPGCSPVMTLKCRMTDGSIKYIYITFYFWESDSQSGSNYYVHFPITDEEWHRVEVDLAEVIERFTPSLDFQKVEQVRAYGGGFRLDDLRFSNSRTVEHNVLAPGVIGHIARHRTWNVSSYKPVATDRWFHYDQVGSVMAETNASGSMTAQYHPDAFGNQMASWETGLWTNTYCQCSHHLIRPCS